MSDFSGNSEIRDRVGYGGGDNGKVYFISG